MLGISGDQEVDEEKKEETFVEDEDEDPVKKIIFKE